MRTAYALSLAALGAGLSTLGAQSPSAAALRLPKLFQDGMVLQRDASIPVWGWAPPRADVVARFRGATAHATAGADGRFKLRLPAAPAGGPYTLAVSAGASRVELHDVLVGDVWLASGQSNMEMTVASSANAAREIATAHDSAIRQIKIPISWAERPADDLAGGSWAPADPKHVGDFSAVAYSFARDVRAARRVPIGIVNATWGGSAIETWLSAEAQGLSPESAAQTLVRQQGSLDSVRNALRARIGDVPERDPGMRDGRAPWADPALDEREWKPIRPTALWESQGYDGMDGIAWYRTRFTLTDAEARQGVTLALGPIDDDDVTWVNGVEVGKTTGYNVPRRYTVPATALRAGENVLAVRVADYGGGGGLYGVRDSLRLEVAGARRPLDGEWRFRVGELAVRMDGQRLNKVPTITYNRMIHPMLAMPIRGVIWYQGESNANNAAQAKAYRAQFRTLITSWRQAWKSTGAASTDFPFLWVQLPGYGAADSVPPLDPGWALQRESMEGALALPRTGRAVMIDADEMNNLHPLDKQTVGQRLALVARRVAYGETVHDAGPRYVSHEIRGDTVVVRLASARGLAAKGGGDRIVGFALAGADHRFVWANARLAGDRVLVWSDRVTHPLAVRYAWANAPVGANLLDGAGLPAAPFRSDDW